MFFSLLPPGEGRFAFENRAEFLEENGDEYLGLQNALMHLYTELQAVPNKPDEVHALARRVEELRVQLGFILEAKDRNTVFWIDRRGERAQPGGATQCFSAGDAHRRFGHSAHHAVRASGVCSADLGNAGSGGWF